MDTLCTVAECNECDFSKLSEKPRSLNMDRERQRSFDERSLSELSIGFSPHVMTRSADNANANFSRLVIDHNPDAPFSPGRRSGFNTPRSLIGYEPHPMVGEAWDALRRSLVYFRGNPVGTIAALDSSEEELNYDQVYNKMFQAFNLLLHLHVYGAYVCVYIIVSKFSAEL